MAVLSAGLCAFSPAWAGDQARSIVNSLDPKRMNELFAALPAQPDAALTNIVAVAPNKFRFFFIWPGSNPFMTYDRLGRSFADRFAALATQLKPLATGFCLPSEGLLLGTATYGEEAVKVAYRDIEVHYQFGWQQVCEGRYLKSAEVEQYMNHQSYLGGYGAGLPAQELPPPENMLKQAPTPPAPPPQPVQ